jgi:uncharacterized protein YndB with AHSA1/START domain
MSGGVSNTYHFVTVWTVEATPDEVFDVLTDAEALPRWWPAVYRRVLTVPLGDGTKKRVLDTQGWLPYRLHWEARVAEHDPPRLLGIRASGDFEGSGLWTLTPDGPRTTVRYEWRIRAQKPLLRTFSVVLKPVFAWNHRWAMARGLESLELELARRSGKDVGPPPGPVSALRSSLILVLVAALLIALGFLTARMMSGLAST